MISIQIQTIIYNTKKESIIRSIESIENSLNNYLKNNACHITISYGDASEHRTFSQKELNDITIKYKNLNIQYTYFGFNSGTSKGHNILGSLCKSNYILIINPDIVFEANLLENFVNTFNDKSVGIVEAKQLPIEHPKEYDIYTGETDWASGACLMIPYSIWREVDGFDENLFLYCDDVDLSWRVRTKGYKIKYNPYACVFHSKFLLNDCNLNITNSEQYYSIEAYLIMLYKWSNNYKLDKLLRKYKNSSGIEKKAYTNFIEKKSKGKLKSCYDPEHKISYFNSGYFTKHRFW